MKIDAVRRVLSLLGCHQYEMFRDVHVALHSMYDPPEIPTEEQAAREIIRAYEDGEMLKRYNGHKARYYKAEIPQDLVDGLIAQYGLRRTIVDMAAA